MFRLKFMANFNNYHFRRIAKCIYSNKELLKFPYLPAENAKRHLQSPKRFYKNVSVAQSNGQFEINLDRRKLKTPLGNILQIPSEPLALAIATEWDAQENIINLQSMHLTTLANTVLDNPMRKTSESLVEVIIGFLGTDTICYRQDEPTELAELQAVEWDPILKWFCERYQVEMNSTKSIIEIEVPAKTKEVLTRHFLSYNFWSLTGLFYAVETLKSVILTLATVDRRLTVEQAVLLTRLELEFQIARWGNVEWAHDVDLMDLRARLAAAVIFVQLNSQSSALKHKATGI